VGLIIYPSEDFNFVNLVELLDLILDLLCVHLKYIGYGGYCYNIPQSHLSMLSWCLGHRQHCAEVLLSVFTDTDTGTDAAYSPATR
jgi:hypothetical protein